MRVLTKALCGEWMPLAQGQGFHNLRRYRGALVIVLGVVRFAHEQNPKVVQTLRVLAANPRCKTDGGGFHRNPFDGHLDGLLHQLRLDWRRRALLIIDNYNSG